MLNIFRMKYQYGEAKYLAEYFYPVQWITFIFASSKKFIQ